MDAGWGLGVPTLTGVDLGTATPVSMTMTFVMNHIDRTGAAGDHWVGINTTPRATVSVTYLGLPTAPTRTAQGTDRATPRPGHSR